VVHDMILLGEGSTLGLSWIVGGGVSPSVQGWLLAVLADTGEGRGLMRGRSLSSCFLRDGDNSNGYFFSDNGRRGNFGRVRNKKEAEEDHRHLVG